MKKMIALTSALVAGSAFASLASSVNVSSNKVKASKWEKFKEKSSVSYFGEFNDQSLNNNEEQNQNFFYNAISGRYQLNDTWTARADLRFETNEGVEDKYSELNPRLGIQGVVYANGNFSVFSLTRLEVATNDDSLDRNRVVKPKFYNAANYSMGAHSLSAGFEVAKWLYETGLENEEGDDKLSKLDTFADMTYRYTFNDKATFQLYYETGATTRPGMRSGDLLKNWERTLVGMDFTVAKNFMNIAKNVTIYPHIDYRPQSDTEAGDLGLGAWISAGFFQ